LFSSLEVELSEQRSGDIDTSRRIFSGGPVPPPAPLIPRPSNGRELRLMDIAPLELARQLTILEFSYFQKIKPVECLKKAWTSSTGEEKAPNVRCVIHMANVLSGWVICNILIKDVKQRAAVMKYFIQTALVGVQECWDMERFADMSRNCAT
jgi:son of sevenless-like protein